MGKNATGLFGLVWVIVGGAALLKGQYELVAAALGISSLHFQIACMKGPRHD